MRSRDCRDVLPRCLGTITIIEKMDPVYTGLIIHDLRRSAVRNMMNAGVGESGAMKISGHKTNNVFKRYHIVSADDVFAASRLVSKAHHSRSQVAPSHILEEKNAPEKRTELRVASA
jgi:hypothetical protein